MPLLRKIRSILLTHIFALCLLLFIVGCSEEKAPSSDLLTMGVTNFADSLEPTDNYFGWVVMRYGLGECLIKFDESMNVTPWLAKDWSISQDTLTWTFIIDERATFSNGNKVTAERVKSALERVFEKSNRAKTFFTYTNIVAKEQTLSITTSQPIPGLPGMLADPLFIIIDTSVKDRDYRAFGPICTGPYMVESFDKGNATMTANPHYWNGDVPYKRVEIKAVDDPTTRAMALQAGEVDIIVNVAPNDLKLFTNNKYTISEISSLRTVLARFNVAKGHPLHDPAVRAALISACNREVYAKVLLQNTFLPGKAPIPPSLDYGFDTLTDPNTYDIERAKKILKDNGWKDTNGDGYVEKEGKTLELDFIYYSGRQELPLLAEATQADAKKVGIKINLKNIDYNILDGLSMRGEYDLSISNIITANTGDPLIFLNWYWKSNVDKNNPQNGSGYSNKEFDTVSNSLLSEFDPDKRREKIIAMQQILMNDGVALFFGYPKTNMVSSTKVQGARILPADYYWLTKDIKPAQ